MADKYDEKDLRWNLEELHELMERGELFAPDIDVPPYFGETGLVKSMWSSCSRRLQFTL